MSEWEAEGGRVAAFLAQQKTKLRGGWSQFRVLRVNQLDAILLDTEINDILKAQFSKIFSFWKGSSVSRYWCELEAVLDFFIFYLSVYSIHSSYGNILQNLHYTSTYSLQDKTNAKHISGLSTLQKVMYGVVTVGGRWAWNRLTSALASLNSVLDSSEDRRGDGGFSSLFVAGSSSSSNSATSSYPTNMSALGARVWRAMNLFEVAYKLASLIHFFIFLYDGKYVSIISRILGMRLIYRNNPALSNNNQRRQVSFAYMNRQLVWHGFTEFLMFVVPLINIYKLRNSLARLLTWRRRPAVTTADANNSNSNSSDVGGHSKQQQHNTKCGICESEPIHMAHGSSSCGHVFCYYCLAENCLLDAKFTCPLCGARITDMHRVTYYPSITNATTTTSTPSAAPTPLTVQSLTTSDTTGSNTT